MEERIALGLSRYGKYLTTNNGRSSLQDLFEELLDATMYCKQKIEEDKMKKVTDYNEHESKLYHNLIEMIDEDKENMTALIELGRLAYKKEKESEDI
jgi:hypothetical protein